ncbi:pentatricopeptide repeat-containing-like protein [Cinnamomum micranthum f. kanehirae]|uniref:Pentatricopeptide repeat-containing-like protein n=1 Tax=Cinnamomum micranthum f. kanehirae TaxID=337451 RepID=A0A443N1I0_9MAGN|nr:pentatricopeptide repeat-containing-like protein [Cinnamomum micranthum f. kanehirae]
MNSFDGAMFVVEETARTASYYNVLVAAKCRNGDFQDALDLYDERRRFGCDPNTKSYNYLLGSLFIVHACRLGSMDFAIEFLYHMMSVGLEPRLTTHAAFIKGYFWSGQVGHAHKYVVDMSSKDKYSANMNYSLLASLFHKSGRVVEARDVLIEMIEKGIKPNFPVYMRVMKDLFKLGKGDLVADLKAKFAKFHSNTGNG